MGCGVQGRQLLERGPRRKRDQCGDRSQSAQTRSLCARDRHPDCSTGGIGRTRHQLGYRDESCLLPGDRGDGVSAGPEFGNFSGLNDTRRTLLVQGLLEIRGWLGGTARWHVGNLTLFPRKPGSDIFALAKPALKLPPLDHSWQLQAVLRAPSLGAFAPHAPLQLRGYYTAYRRFRSIAAFSWIQPRRRVLCLGETWNLPAAPPAASCSTTSSMKL